MKNATTNANTVIARPIMGRSKPTDKPETLYWIFYVEGQDHPTGDLAKATQYAPGEETPISQIRFSGTGYIKIPMTSAVKLRTKKSRG